MATKKKQPKRQRRESSFQKNLAAILNERGLSQRGAAEICEVNSGTVNQWLSGTQPYDLDAILKLCKALNCDFQWLLTGSRSQKTSKGVPLSEIFDLQEEPSFSGIFEIQAKRLKRKGSVDE